MIGFPFDSHVTYDEEGNPEFDRAISSAPYRALLKELFKTGIMPTYENNMQVVAGEDLTVIVKPGFAMVEGCMKLEEDERTLAIQAADRTHDRIDTVVLRLNDNDAVRACDFYVLEGTPATEPVRPELTRNNAVFEIGLADIFVPQRSTTVTDYRITDTRYDNERCGIISSISEINTTGIYTQIQADLEHFRNTNEADFDAWFDRIKGQLSEDAAGHLQNEIDALNQDMSRFVQAKDPLEPVDPAPRDADTLGGLYSADDITEIKQDLTATDGEPFRYAKKDGQRGILVNEGGADTFYPFKSGELKTLNITYISNIGGFFRWKIENGAKCSGILIVMQLNYSGRMLCDYVEITKNNTNFECSYWYDNYDARDKSRISFEIEENDLIMLNPVHSNAWGIIRCVGF